MDDQTISKNLLAAMKGRWVEFKRMSILALREKGKHDIVAISREIEDADGAQVMMILTTGDVTDMLFQALTDLAGDSPNIVVSGDEEDEEMVRMEIGGPDEVQ